MNPLPQIRVMLSSRSMSSVFSSSVTLTDVRKRLQAHLHALRWSSADAREAHHTDPIFDVWIHEPATEDASRNTFELSLREIQRADIILVLYTGEAGSANDDEQIGICHAELREALARRGDVVHLIELQPLATTTLPRDLAFRDYIAGLSLFHTMVKNEAELQVAAVRLVHKAVAELVHRGASGGRRRDHGHAMNWSRLDLTARQSAMRQALAKALDVQGDSKSAADRDTQVCRVELAGVPLACRLDAIPDALTVAAARERVGQPFLRDHLHVAHLDDDLHGIVHIIACHRGVTERQASAMLGTPDAIAVASDFGVYAADHVQQIQLFFLAQCMDESAIGVAVRRLNQWLAETGEIERVVARARGRRRILTAVVEAGRIVRPRDPTPDERQAKTKRPKS